MAQEKDSEGKFSRLRTRAEETLGRKPAELEDISALSPDEIQQLVHELRVHQIELEMQNEDLRQAQIKLEELKDRYLDLYDFAPVGYVTLSDKGLLLEANLTAVRLLGVERQSLTKMFFSRFVCKEFESAYFAHLQLVFEARSKQACEINLARQDGTHFHAQLESMAVQDESGEFSRCRTIVTDISERKRAEESLYLEKEKLKSILDHMIDGVYIVNSHYEIEYANPTLVSDRGDVAGQKCHEYLVRLAEPCPWCKNREVFAGDSIVRQCNSVQTGKTYDIFETLIKNHDGSMSRLLMLHDITRLKTAEDALSEREEHYRALLQGLLDSVPDIVFFKDLDGIYLGCNQEFANFVGRSQEEIIGRTDYDLVPKEVADSFRENDRLLLELGKCRHNDEWIDYPDGRRVLVNTFEAPLRSLAGETLGVIGVARDITQRHIAEQRLRESEENFRTFFETLDDLIVVAAPNGRMTYTNSTLGKKLGYTAHEILSMHVLELHPPDKRQEAEKIFGEMFRGERDFCLLPLQRKNGALIPVETRVWFGKWSGEDCIFGICKDLRKEQEALQKFNRLFSSNPALMAVTTLPERFFSDVNDTFLNTLGYSKEEVLGRTAADLGIFVQQALAERLAEDGRVSNIELKVRRKDGVIVDGLFSGEVIESQGQKMLLTVMTNITDLKRAEESLRTANAYNRTLIEASLDPLVTISVEGEITDVNAGTERVTGYSRSELIGTDFADYFTDRSRAKDGYQQVFRDGLVRDYELEIKHRDGRLTPVLYNASVYNDQSGKITGVFAAARDITDLKRAQDALRQREAFLRAMLNNVPFLMWLKDREGRFLAVNELLAKSCGRESPNDMIGKTDFDFYPSDLAESCRADDRAVMRSMAQKTVEEPIVDRGKTKWFETFKMPILDDNGHVLGTTGFARDITDQRQERIEERRRAQESQKLLATAVEQAVDAIVITDPSGNIQYVNPAFEKVSGYERNEVIGQNPRFLKSGNQPEAFYRDLWKTISAGKIWRGAFTNKTKDGRLIHDETTISPVKDSAGKIVNYICVKKDVSAIIRLQTQLAQSQKMEAIGTLAGGIAHDFNNILFAITGYTELAMEGLPEGSQAQSDLQRVLHSSMRAGDMVKQILAFSHQGQPERKPLDLASLIKEGLKFLRASIPSTVEIRQKIALGLGKVSADPTQVHQVLMNLCTNAAHAMRDGKGVLSISLSSTQVDTAFAEKHPPLVPGPYITLVVSDTGRGIPPDLLDRIFEPYFTTKPTGEGTGLGLSVLYGIVRSHGGIVTVVSEPGQGASFTVYLPVVEEEEAEEETAVSGEYPIAHERILLVDDEQILVDMGQAVLERLGYEVVPQTSPIEAVEVFRSDPERFDLVIMDLTMPKMTGVELATELTAIRPDVPLILCTGFSEKIKDEAAKEFGFRAILGKPILKKDIAKVVREVLDRKD